MKRFYFTFGYGHADANNEPLDDCYTIVPAENYEKARQIMFEVWGTVWAFQYDEEEWKNANLALKLKYIAFPPSQFRKEEDEET